MTLRSTASSLGGFALLSGLLQIHASVVLGMAPLGSLTRAAAEGPDLYIAGAGALGIGGLFIWLLRGRPVLAAAAFVLWQAVLWWPLSQRITWLGLALHGEFLLHHFITLVAAAILALAMIDLAKAAPLGKGRWAALLALATATGMLLVAHLLEARPHDPMSADLWVGLGAIALLVGVGGWGGLGLVRQGRSPGVIAAMVLAVPLAVRLAVAGPTALTHTPVPTELRPWFSGLLALAVLSFGATLRPQVSVARRIPAAMVAGVIVGWVYFLYQRVFGDIEDGLGPLIQSLLGFAPPYPSYLPGWVLFAAMLVAFVALQTTGMALSSPTTRTLGIGAGLVLVAGLGWSTPQLVLMSGAGLTLLLLGAPAPAPSVAPAVPLNRMLPRVGEALGLEFTQVSTEASDPGIAALRGRLRSIPVQLRARQDEGGEVRLVVGERGHLAPALTLVPGPGGEHVCQGDAHQLDHWGAEVLEALAPFGSATAKLWPAGAEVLFGPDLGGMDEANLGRLLRVLASAMAPE